MLEVRQGSNGTTNSIEILAMISEQEINRRNVLGANGTSTATSASTSSVFAPAAHDNSPTSGSSKSNTNAGVVMADSCTTFQRVKTTGDSRYYKSGDRVMTSECSFIATRQNNMQTFGYDQIDIINSAKKRNNNNNSKNGPKNDILLKTEGTFSSYETNHFTTSGIYKNKNCVENTSTNTTMGTSNLTHLASASQAPHLSSRQSNKFVGSRGGGRSVSYSDYSNEHPLPEERDCWALSTRTTSSPVFPLKLHETLTQIESDGYDDIIGWLPHGRSFKIHKQKEFTEIILPRYAILFVSS